jgi:predicted nucleotidyltransferase
LDSPHVFKHLRREPKLKCFDFSAPILGSARWTRFELWRRVQFDGFGIDAPLPASRYPLDTMAILQRLPVDEAHLEAFCRQWKIAELELFGPMLIQPSRAQHIDLPATFAPDARWGLFERERMQNELAKLLGRSVDLISRRTIEASGNALRRNAILGGVAPIYAAG